MNVSASNPTALHFSGVKVGEVSDNRSLQLFLTDDETGNHKTQFVKLYVEPKKDDLRFLVKEITKADDWDVPSSDTLEVRVSSLGSDRTWHLPLAVPAPFSFLQLRDPWEVKLMQKLISVADFSENPDLKKLWEGYFSPVAEVLNPIGVIKAAKKVLSQKDLPEELRQDVIDGLQEQANLAGRASKTYYDAVDKLSKIDSKAKV